MGTSVRDLPDWLVNVYGLNGMEWRQPNGIGGNFIYEIHCATCGQYLVPAWHPKDSTWTREQWIEAANTRHNMVQHRCQPTTQRPNSKR